MTTKFTKFNNDDRAFSGLEAAIVLIAFVVVAAAFSFAVLNAGFFATQEATGAIHTGLEEATSAMQLAGEIVVEGDIVRGNATFVEIPIMLAAGRRPVDLSINSSVVTYVDLDVTRRNLHFIAPAGAVNNSTLIWVLRHDRLGVMDDILEYGELVVIRVPVRNTTAPWDVNLRRNEVFTISVQPPRGASLVVERTVPSVIEPRMILRN